MFGAAGRLLGAVPQDRQFARQPRLSRFRVNTVRLTVVTIKGLDFGVSQV